jgi:hypothetical protein
LKPGDAAPTHPGQTIEPVKVTTPEQGWPLTGVLRSTRREPQPPTSTSCSAVTAICPTAAFWPGSRASPCRSALLSKGPAPTDTQFHTVEINRQYDFFADFPLYPLNLVADANALLGFFYVHLYGFDVSLAPDPTTSPAYQGTHGDTSYYFFETQDLPLFAPLRTLGVPEPVIDVVEPVFKVIVDLGYDRNIPPWEPTPARLIPPLNPATVATDLVNAVGEGINNALALTGSPPLLNIPAPDTRADTNGGGLFGSPDKLVDRNAFGDSISNSLGALNPLRTDQGNKQAGTDGQNSMPQTHLGRWTKLTPKSLTDGFKFTPLTRSSSKADNQTGGPLAKVGANIGDSLQQVGKKVEKTIKNHRQRHQGLQRLEWTQCRLQG